MSMLAEFQVNILDKHLDLLDYPPIVQGRI